MFRKNVTQLAHIKDTESGKLRFYSRINQQFQIQKYLTFGNCAYFYLKLGQVHILLQLKLADMADLQCQQLKDTANTVKIK